MNHPQAARFRIGSAVMGPGEPVYVIAEAGVNHDGSIDVARQLVDAAAEAGADAVKFQVFSADRLVVRNAPAAGYQKRAANVETQHEILSRLELSHDTFRTLAAHAAERNIAFLATPFSIADLRFLASLPVAAIKLASTDIVNEPLQEAAVQTGLPVIASTGAADLEEIARAVDRFTRDLGGPLALLHCVSSYPATEAEANLGAIGTLARTFGCVTGFSDHTESLTIGGHAVCAGARVIEKHFTLDRSRSGPDHAFSLEPGMLAEYIGEIRRAERMLGDGAIAPTPGQQEVRDLARGSVVAARDIRNGEILTEAMLTVKRPGGGIRPDAWRQLIGRTVDCDIPADTPLTWAVVGPQPVAAAGQPTL